MSACCLLIVIAFSLPFAGGKLRLPYCCQPLPQTVSSASLGPVCRVRRRSPDSCTTSWQSRTAFQLDTLLFAAVLGHVLPSPYRDMALEGTLWIVKNSCATAELHQSLILLRLLPVLSGSKAPVLSPFFFFSFSG